MSSFFPLIFENDVYLWNTCSGFSTIGVEAFFTLGEPGITKFFISHEYFLMTWCSAVGLRSMLLRGGYLEGSILLLI